MLRSGFKRGDSMGTALELPTIEVSGGRRDVGRQHGEAARSQIRDSIGYYRESFKRLTGLEQAEIRRGAPRCVTPIDRQQPRITAEIRWASAGTRVSFGEWPFP